MDGQRPAALMSSAGAATPDDECASVPHTVARHLLKLDLG